MQYGLGASLRHVLGATVGFVVLLLFTGLGLHEVLDTSMHGKRASRQNSGVALGTSSSMAVI